MTLLLITTYLALPLLPNIPSFFSFFRLPSSACHFCHVRFCQSLLAFAFHESNCWPCLCFSWVELLALSLLFMGRIAGLAFATKSLFFRFFVPYFTYQAARRATHQLSSASPFDPDDADSDEEACDAVVVARAKRKAAAAMAAAAAAAAAAVDSAARRRRDSVDSTQGSRSNHAHAHTRRGDNNDSVDGIDAIVGLRAGDDGAGIGSRAFYRGRLVTRYEEQTQKTRYN
jgi:hypothetical protein